MQREFEQKQTTTAEETDFERLLTQVSRNPYEPSTFDEAWRLAEIVARSGMYGLGGSPEAAHIILMAGRDLGLSQSQALQGISCIRGKAAPDARTLVAICLSRPRTCEYFEPVEQTDARATWATKRRGRPERRYTFTIEDAKRAGLLSGKVDSGWAKWPARMLSARAMAFLARDVYPDLTLGMHTAEELQSDVTTEVPSEIAGLSDWQKKASPAEASPPVDDGAGMLDPVPPPPEPADWRDRMRSAPDKATATRIGRDAIAADPSRRAEATAILNGRSEK